MKFKRVFVKGGVKRMKYTCPALIFALFRLSIELINKSDQESYQVESSEEAKDSDEIALKLTKVDQVRIFKCISELIGHIKTQYPELSLRLYL